MALDNFRTIELIWDKANKSIIKTIKTASSDTTGRYFSVKVLDEGQEVDLIGAKLQLYWEHPNFNTNGTDDFTIVDTKGKFLLTFSDEMLTNVGELNAYLVLTLTDGKITSDGFPIKVFKGADDGVVVPTNGSGLVKQIANKIDKGNVTLNDLTQEVKLAITGGSVAVVGENAVGTENIKDRAVTRDKTTFFEKGKNKVDNTKFTTGYYVNPNNGTLATNASHMTSDYTALKPNTKHTVNYHGRLAFYANRNVESFVSGLDFSSTAPPVTFTTPANANYARYSINSTTALETFQIEEGETSTPYERFYEKIPQELLNLPETADYAEPYLIKGGTDDVPSAPFIGALDNGTRVDLNPIEDDGVLRRIEFRASKSGSVKVKFLSLAENMLTLENEVSLTTHAGYNIYEANIDFAPFNVEKGWLVGYYSSPDNAKLPFIAGTGIGSYNIAGVDVTGTVNATTTASYNIAISVTVEQTIEQLASKIDKLSVGGASASTEPSRLLLSEIFEDSSAPPQFTNSGFTLGNGASFSGTGGLTNQLVWTKDSTLNTSKTRVWFTPENTTPDLAIVRKHPLAVSLGGIFRLDGANKKLIMYAPWTQNTTSLPAIAKESTLTVPIIANRQYLLELERQTIRNHILRITDTITGESQEVVNDYVDTRLFSIGSGHVGVMAFGGSFTINKIQYASNEPTKPRIAFYGDSFVEAATLILDGGVQLRYADLVKSKLGGSAHINGRGGDKSDTLVNKLSTDFTTERADYVVLAIGTNDTVFDTWLTNIEKLIEAVEAKGSIPILMTLTKITSSDRTAFMTAVNNWILNSGYLYVDANLATTLNNDRQTQNTSLFKTDGVHPNVDGHEVIYRRFLLDVPEVFDGY